MEFDIVILVGPNDYQIFKKSIEYTKKNIIGYRNIYIVSPVDQKVDGTIFVDEKMFCISMNTVRRFHGENSRNGWYFQQLMKLYAGKCIPNLLTNYLVIDADTCFLKPTRFFDEDNKPYFTVGYEYNNEYFVHMNVLHPSFKRRHTHSGISHHCMFNQIYIKEIMYLVHLHHNKPFYQVFLESVSKSYITGAGASEYEIYFHYLVQYYLDKISIRELKWDNMNTIPDEDTEHDYISCHHWLSSI